MAMTERSLVIPIEYSNSVYVWADDLSRRVECEMWVRNFDPEAVENPQDHE